MKERYKILIAEDETNMRKLICSFLIKEGYDIVEAEDGLQATKLAQIHNDIDLYILDVMMPNKNGYEACKEIKSFRKQPILMLTAKSQEEDQIKGFLSGADDYLVKPFSIPILLLRIKSLIKRSPELNSNEIIFQNLIINLSEHKVFVNKEEVELTYKEFELLLFLIKNKNIVLSRETILSSIWNFGDYFGDVRNVDTHIKNLRIKIKDQGTIIKTIRGYGYKIEDSSK